MPKDRAVRRWAKSRLKKDNAKYQHKGPSGYAHSEGPFRAVHNYLWKDN